MTSPDQGAPTPGADQPFAAPGTGSGWGGAPSAPAPSGYEAQLPTTPPDTSPYAVRGPGATSPYGAPDAAYGAQPGYGGTPGHGSAPGYGTAPADGTATGDDGTPGYGVDSAYGTAQPGYGTPPAYGTAQPGYGTAPAYGTAQPGYGTPPGYGTAQPGYGTPPAYGTPYAVPAGHPTAYAPYGAWAPPVARPTDGLAIASLVLSCSSFLLYLTAPVGLGLGIAALRRIGRTGAQGRGLAIAGIVVGGVVTAFMLAFLVLMFGVVAGSAPASSWMTNADAGAALAPALHGLAGAAPR